MSTTTTPERTDHPVLLLSSEVLEQARVFFEECGARGCEGTALIAGTTTGTTTGASSGVEDAGGVLHGDTLVIPDQLATPVPRAGVSVSAAGDLDVVLALRPDQQYHARIHSHPALAFHSRTDDNNPALTHRGALSIVVPFFGLGLRHGLDACAVFVRQNQRWRELRAGDPERDQWVRVDE